MKGIVLQYHNALKTGRTNMDIDRLNHVQKTVTAYTPKKYAKSDSQESVNKEDTLTLTEEAQELLSQRRENKEKKQKSADIIQLEMLVKQLENANKKEHKVVNMSKCFKIAARISNGDKVPLKDMKFLRENAPELYKNALLFKKLNPEPKKYKSCLDKEDEEASKNRQDAMFDTSVGADDAIVLNLEA